MPDVNQQVIDVFDPSGGANDYDDIFAKAAASNTNSDSGTNDSKDYDDIFAKAAAQSKQKGASQSKPPLSPQDSAKYDRLIEATNFAKNPLDYVMGKAEDVVSGYGDQLKSGYQSAKNLVTGNSSTAPTPQTNALAQKVKAGTAQTSDYSNALLSQVATNPAGQFANAVGSIIPGYALAGSAVNKLINPAIENVTGVDPANLQAGELIGGTALGAKIAPEASGKGIVDQIKAPFTSDAPAPITSDDIKQAASAKYAQADASGAALKGSVYNSALQDMEAALPPTAKGMAVTGETTATKTLEAMKQFKDQPLTLSEAQDLDEHLGAAIEKEITPTGQPTKDGLRLIKMQDAFRDKIFNASPDDVTVSRKYSNDDLTAANQELDKLTDIHDNLINDIQEKSKLAGQQGGFWRGRSLTAAAEQAKNLYNIKQQMADQQSKINDINNNLKNTPDPQNDQIASQNAFQAWKEGSGLWSSYLKLRDIENINEKAQYKDNPVTYTKNQFANLATNGKRLNGYTPEEQAAIQNAAKTGAGTDALRIIGSRLNPIIAGSIGGFPGAAAAYTASGIARVLANRLQSNRLTAVENAIRNRPIVQNALGSRFKSKIPDYTNYLSNSLGIPASESNQQ